MLFITLLTCIHCIHSIVTFFAPAKEEEDDYETDAEVTESNGKTGVTQKSFTGTGSYRRSFSRSPTKRGKSPVRKRSSVKLAAPQALVTRTPYTCYFMLLVSLRDVTQCTDVFRA
jgi:hypothetical protein